jgi:hypothetical protein
MRKQFLLILLASSVVFAQSAPVAQSNPAPAAPSPSTSPQSPPAAAQAPAEVPPSAPVITLHGLCPDKPAGTDPKSPECQTVVTRAEFEHLANTLSPNMPATAKQSLASDYARMLVIDNEARKRGLENTQHYRELVEFLKMQLLAQELFRSYQEQAKPTAAEVEKYYNDNAAKYEELSVKRLFIPRNRPDEVQALQKPGSSATPKPATDAELQAQGEKIRTRLMAGGDFEKLQKEVYESAGYKTPPPPTTVPNWRHDAIAPSEQQLFELKPNEFSKVMVQPAGAYIYQIESKKEIPLAEVKPQIEATMTNENLRRLMDGVMAGVTPEVNQAYFRSIAAEAATQQAATPAAAMPAPTDNPHPPAAQKPVPVAKPK